MDLFKSIAGKVATGIVALAVAAAGVWWWQASPETRGSVAGGTGRAAAWAAGVVLVPWATFWLIGRVGRADSNAAGAALVGAYTVVEVALLAWLFGWSMGGGLGWAAFAVGGLFAGAYNLLACDWIAERAA